MFLIRNIFFALASMIVAVKGTSFDDSISFFVYPQNGSPLKYSSTDRLEDLGCVSTGLWAFIVHGYRDSPQNAPWIPDLAGNLSLHRGGCVIVMDYSNYTVDTVYSTLVSQFKDISLVLLKMVNQVLGEGFKLQNGYAFGFSYGAHLIFNTGIEIGGKLARIDACEPARPGFENTDLWREPTKAAINVQCIHTSTNLGTKKRECHQNWLMRNCGVTQPAASFFRGHSSCPYIFNSAFENMFFAEPNPMKCVKNVGTVAESYPDKLRMGYMDERISQVSGTIFSRTYATANYAKN